MTTLPTKPFELDQFHQSSTLDILKRHFTPYNLSLLHAIFCLIAGPLALFYHAPDLNIPQWFVGPDGYLLSPTPIGIMICFLVTSCYYFWDTYCIFKITSMVSNGQLKFDDFGYLLHHFSCTLGMLFPAVFRVDGPLVMFAFIQGELSNPPRGIAEAFEFEMESMKTAVANRKFSDKEFDKYKLTPADLQRRYQSIFDRYLVCLDIHFYSFFVFRAILTWYTFFVVLPFAQLTSTFIAAALMTVFSIGSIFVLIPQRIARNKQLHLLSQLYDTTTTSSNKQD